MKNATFLPLIALAALICLGAGAAPSDTNGQKREKRKMTYCHACGFSLSIPGFKGKSETYCSHCTDEDGKFNVARKEVQKVIADWFKTWQPDIDDAKAMKRADHYLKALPHWAED